MKSTLTLVLLAISCIGLSAGFAQTTQPTVPPASPQDATPQPPAGNPQQAPPSEAAPDAEPGVYDGLLTDNGLWGDAEGDQGCAVCGGGSCAPPDWYTIQGVRVLSRSKPRAMGLSFTTSAMGSFAALETSGGVYQVRNLPGGTTITSEVLGTKSFGLGVAPAYDMTIGHYFCRDRNNNDHFIEFTFWGIMSWNGSKTVNGYLVPVYDETSIYDSAQATLINEGAMTPKIVDGQKTGSLRTTFPEPFQMPGATNDQKTISFAFNNGVTQSFSYTSSMNNYEVDGRISPRGEQNQMVLQPDGRWRPECRPGTYMSYLYGLRVMTIDESAMFQSWSQGLDPFLDSSITTGRGDYSAVTHNTLLGLQIGADITFRKCKWSWGVNAKVGPYVNWATQESALNAYVDEQSQHDVTDRYQASRCLASLVGEVGFDATYKFRPNLVGRASYDFMWITGLALAPDQLQFVASPTDRINTNGQAFCQGVSFSLEWLW